MGNAHPIDGRPQSEVQVGPDKLKGVASFCYLGDMLSAGGGCEITVTTCVKTVWKKFRELLPVLTSSHLCYKTRGYVYSSCVRSSMPVKLGHWPRWTCSPMIGPWSDGSAGSSIKQEDVATVRSSQFLSKLELEDLYLILRKRLCWFGHVEHSSGAVRTACDKQIDGRWGGGGWQGGPSLHGRNWKKTAVSGSSLQLTIKKGAPRD